MNTILESFLTIGTVKIFIPLVPPLEPPQVPPQVPPLVPLLVRDGHADADDADSCRMMRICAYAYACRQKKSDSAKREKLTFLKRQ